ncbi:hypothetical protein PHYSODRAFT_333368 [Phytophthora sojae]|uniref:BZIP domain-containing protein n=1 Tax=Phytophthora sojae (strain P6497) TaxID=1094619 RepID=G4ZNS3_PHYSP|nr:hypothetical protein PHYSODRAFT_333368 [Phytophthora sojae]EGZ15096.1 hypothetical protein PHYSODRAFT_333368 [Phytophthora sojae]|eukprot:XP_009528845.1 hypothetical protein PHYSODRAFT_333368 [Phytophthora sojae]
MSMPGIPTPWHGEEGGSVQRDARPGGGITSDKFNSDLGINPVDLRSRSTTQLPPRRQLQPHDHRDYGAALSPHLGSYMSPARSDHHCQYLGVAINRSICHDTRALAVKREVANSPEASASDDWQSDTDALLDCLPWDELRDLSPPCTPRSCAPTDFSPSMDAIRGASPLSSPAVRVHTLRSGTGSGLSPIRGEDEEPLRHLTGGGATSLSLHIAMNSSQIDAMWASVHSAGFTSAAMPMMDTPMAPPPLTWTNSDISQQVIQCDQLPNASAMDRRRQKNRECMRRARQRQRDELNSMKATVARLEKLYAELSLQSTSGSRTNVQEGAVVSRVATDYAQAVELSRRLGAENLYLKAEIQQQAAWKLNLSRILQSRMEVDGPRWARQFQQPSLGGEEVLRMRLDERDQFEAAEEFGFHPLTDLGLTQVLLENSRTMSRVHSRLLIPSSLDTDDGARTRRITTFGWDMVQRVHDNIMECVLTKRFHGLNVAQLMQKTWANDMRLGEFKKVKGETSRLEVLQTVNPNAYVLVRDVTSPTEDISTFRSVFVRFLIETSKKIPASDAVKAAPTGIDASAPSMPPPYTESDSECEDMILEATGYVLSTQSFDTDYSRNPRQEDVRNKVAWAHLSLSIEFLNVVNPVTGEEYQQLRWTGRTNYCGPEHAQRNASDMMQGMLRWELLVISPAVNLVSLSLE